jgi:hypothetical protein
MRYLEKSAEGEGFFKAGQEVLEQVSGWNSRRKANDNNKENPPPGKIPGYMNHRKIFKPVNPNPSLQGS